MILSVLSQCGQTDSGCTHLAVQRVSGLFSGGKWLERYVEHCHLVLGVRMSGGMPLLHIYAFMVEYRVQDMASVTNTGSLRRIS
jgi:hypothetical protein